MENVPKAIRMQDNQYIIKIGNKLIFQSYKSTMAVYDRENDFIRLDNDESNYTRTTVKYLNMFLKDYCGGIQKKDCIRTKLN